MSLNEAKFQSTHPSRGATAATAGTRKRALFQSTHPSRGATWGASELEHVFDVSIHAPLAGCDLIIFLFRVTLRKFQSTHPSRGAT